MKNPLEFKHDITSYPLKWMWKQYDPQDDIVPYALVGMATAVANLFPAAGLIQAGVRGEQMFSHVTYARFNPWAKPIFHYTQAASKAERIGARVGSVVGANFPFFNYSSSRKAWAKAGAKTGAKLGGRLIPGVGWALLAYDVYDVAYNQSLWGFDLS